MRYTVIPIEVSSNEENDTVMSESLGEDNVDTSESVTEVDQSTRLARPRRAAAVLGERTRRTWTEH